MITEAEARDLEDLALAARVRVRFEPDAIVLSTRNFERRHFSLATAQADLRAQTREAATRQSAYEAAR